jgi:large subunit ribosomal protein L24
MQKIRKGDTVQVMKGKDAGKKGKVLMVFRSSGRVLVEALNLHKKHRKATQQNQQGGIINIEAPIAGGNLMVVCKNCSLPSRIGFQVTKDNVKNRICKKCNGVV